MLMAASASHAGVLDVTKSIVGVGATAHEYAFVIQDAGLYAGELIDFEFPFAFDFLGLAISKTGGAPLVTLDQPGSFSLSLDPGSYTGIVFANLQGGPFGAYSLSVSLVPEPHVWLMLGVGLALVSWQRLRARPEA
jgi:hypothetical protein